MPDKPNTQDAPELRGRPPIYGRPMLRRNVSLPPEHWAKLEEIGHGNRSEGIRRLVEAVED